MQKYFPRVKPRQYKFINRLIKVNLVNYLLVLQQSSGASKQSNLTAAAK